MKRKLKLIVLLVTCLHSLYAQVKLGDNPTTEYASSAFEIESTNTGLLFLREVNTALIINPVNGMIVFDLSSNCKKIYKNVQLTNLLPKGLIVQLATSGRVICSSCVFSFL